MSGSAERRLVKEWREFLAWQSVVHQALERELQAHRPSLMRGPMCGAGRPVALLEMRAYDGRTLTVGEMEVRSVTGAA